MDTTITSINDYINQFPPEIVSLLQQVRATIKKAAPKAEEAISYGMPTFKLHGNLVHFAAFKNHIGFYPAPSGLEAFQSEIAKYKHSKGAVQFPLTEKLPLALITKITKFRVNENIAKAAAKKK